MVLAATPGTDGDPVAARLAAGWAAALHGSSYAAMNLAPLSGFLLHLAQQVAHEVRTGGARDRAALRAIGRELVEAHFTGPTTLDAVLDVLRRELAPTADTPERVGHALWVQATLAAGYHDAMLDRVREEQERITASALGARVAAERARWASEARFAAVFASAPVGIGVAHVDGTVVEVNDALCRMFGLRRGEFLGRTIYDFVDPDREPEHVALLARMVAGGIDHERVAKSYVRATGETFHTELALSLVREPDGEPRFLLAMVVDLSERHALEDRHRHVAEHDPLTGLPNRTVFYRRLEAALAAGTPPVGLCFLDLDGFKGVNDTLGHTVGDELLRTVAGRLGTELGAAGHLVARLGGDEFVVLVADAGQGLVAIAEQAVALVRRPVRIDGRDLRISTSVGVVGSGDPGAPRTAAGLMKAADTTLRRAKEEGRDRHARFDAELHRTHIERSTRSARMAGALDRGEFELLYQPLVRLSDRRMTGVEALLRWRCDGRLLSPDEFVPLAEESGLIVPLGRWVLEHACRQASAWRSRSGPALLLSVNLAARQVLEPGLVEDVARILDETGWPAEALQLELTETDAMATSGEPLEVLRALARLGVRIAIDDFGTGYSNLAYLRDLPVHVLKLAGPFVSGREGSPGVGGDEVDAAVLAHVVRLAHTLGLAVIAEHVETAEQEERLRVLGCDAGQGWLFGHPVPADAITERLAAG